MYLSIVEKRIRLVIFIISFDRDFQRSKKLYFPKPNEGDCGRLGERLSRDNGKEFFLAVTNV